MYVYIYTREHTCTHAYIYKYTHSTHTYLFLNVCVYINAKHFGTFCIIWPQMYFLAEQDRLCNLLTINKKRKYMYFVH